VAERHNLERLARVKREKNSPDSRAGSAFGNQRETLTLLFGIGERLVDLHVAHTFLFKENKEVGSIGRGEPIVTLGGDGEMAKMMAEGGGLPSPSARGHDLHTAGDYYDGNN
jgi:hypothetical protein